MKKSLVTILALTLALTFTACGNNSKTNSTGSANNESSSEVKSSDASTGAGTESSSVAESTSAASTESSQAVDTADDPAAKSEGVMTYAEYEAAALDSEVTIEAYVQAHQAWWEKDGVGVITVYAQDKDGAYFMYEMKCSKEDSEKLVPGTKIKVQGRKAEWSGEVEIVDAAFEILEGSYVAEAEDVTALLDSADLVKSQNKLVAFKGMTIESYTKDGEDYKLAFVYKDNNSGDRDSNSDLYFNASVNGKTYTFCVESYLCDNTTDVYKAVESLQVGDVVDLEGFLYWYNGANPHITSVTKK